MAHLTFPLKTNDDPEITCFICGEAKCEYDIELFSPGRRSWAGVHHKCANFHENRARWKLDEPDDRTEDFVYETKEEYLKNLGVSNTETLEQTSGFALFETPDLDWLNWPVSGIEFIMGPLVTEDDFNESE